MSALPKIVIPSALLIALALCAPPAYSGSASAGPASAASAPSAGVVTAAPAASIATAGRSSGSGSSAPLQVLQDWLAPGSRAGTPILVVPAKEMPREMYDRIIEDLSVMSRIIEKSLREGSDEAYGSSTITSLYLKYDGYGQNLFLPSDGAGPRILRSSGGRPKALYIGGYGAVFSLRVNVPLVPPPEAPQPEKAAGQKDQVWTSAQRELADPEGAARTRRAGSAGEPYKAEAVENVKNTLTAVLKHASNIRDLEPNSWLTILVQGPAAVPQPAQDAQNSPLALPMPPATGSTLLTIRAKKADIDQFAQGQLDETQFRQRVQIVTR